MRRILFVLFFLLSSEDAWASEKVFVTASQTCYLAGGQAWAEAKSEPYLTEVVGLSPPQRAQFCGKGTFGMRQCKEVSIYSFQFSCRGGLASAPQVFIALFGKDSIENRLSVIGNQLCYI